MNRRNIGLIGFLVIAFIMVAILSSASYVINPGERGVKVTLGDMSMDYIKPGFGLKMPFVTDIRRFNVQQDTKEVQAECFSSDLQQINIRIKVLYRIPETSIVSVLRDYSRRPF